MRKICIFTGTRAEYGLLKPLMELLDKDTDCTLQIIASGMHPSPEFGLTFKIIESYGFAVDEKIGILHLPVNTLQISVSDL
jgi:GDP/UDP-N,N'-diacetylbacillosamine 2-epimerase (hydrolysing)